MQKYTVAITGLLISFCLDASAANQIALKSEIPLAVSEDGGVFASECDAVVGNLVANCGFETGDFTGWTQSGDLTYTAVDTVPHSGGFGAYFGPVNSLGFIAQNVSTAAGQLYNLTFWLRNAQQPNRFQVFWNGVLLADSTNLDDFPYTQFTFNGLVASGGATELKFGFYNLPDFFFLDDVVVVSNASACSSDGPDVGSCCGVRYLANPGCPSNVVAGSIPMDYPLDEELNAFPTQPGICSCDGQPFAFPLSARVAVNLPNNVGRPGNRANIANAFQMDYRAPGDPQPSPFMCGDFAWTADEAAKKVGGFASWQLALYADNYAGHGVNIVKVNPPFPTVNFKFCVIEPKQDNTVACWFQSNGDKPNALPQYVITQLQNAYPGWNQNKRTSMWSAGQPANWGDPFAIQGMRNRFETRTQYNTANWSRAYVQ